MGTSGGLAAAALLLAVAWAPPSSADRVADAMEAWRGGDPGRAVRLWRAAAAAGEDRAGLFLGHAYATGRGVERDPRRALAWYRRAAEVGSAQAQWELGLMHELGEGTEADVAEAERWYARAVGQGLCPGEVGSVARLLATPAGEVPR